MAFSTAVHRLSRATMPQPSGSFFHLHLVSDATGETLITVARAAAAQYARVAPIEHIYPLVRTEKQLDPDASSTRSRAAPGVVLYTLLDRELTDRLEAKCREFGIPYLSILGPVLALFQSYLGAESTRRIGAQHTLNAEYFKRIDALNYTMLHDDGQHTDDLEHADVVLVGVSRTSKTPTSIYLANRGVKTANVPLVPNMPVAARARAAHHAACRRPACEPGTDRADPPEPPARPQRAAARRRSLYRPPGRHGGDRLLAPALRQAQLADHRRHAAARSRRRPPP